MSAKIVELSDAELHLLINALRSFVSDFGHDEADILKESHELLAKLQLLQNQAEPSHS